MTDKRRVTSDALLVGSLPLASTEQCLRAGGALFGDIVPALPDGETGDRAMWVHYECLRLLEPHPDVEVLHRPTPPDGVAKELFDQYQFRLREGVGSIRFDSLPRIDDALASYERFTDLRAQGIIPEGVRFQLCLPTPPSGAGFFFRANFDADFPVVVAAYVEALEREMQRLLQDVPAHDLAVQWDVCVEVLDLELGLMPWSSDDAWSRYEEQFETIGPLVPAEVLLGYHFCYGTFPEWPMVEADDLALLVRLANSAVKRSGRPVDWLHIAGPRYLRSEDDSFFRPLQDLDPGEARVFLGLVLPLDGVEGLERRMKTARRYLSDFGVAHYCGFGRQPGEGTRTLSEHAEVIRAALSREQH